MKKILCLFLFLVAFGAAVADVCVYKKFNLTFTGMVPDAQGTPQFSFIPSVVKGYQGTASNYAVTFVYPAVYVYTPSVANLRAAVQAAIPAPTATPVVVLMTPTPTE